MSEVFGLFPTPFMRVPAVLPPLLVRGLVDQDTDRLRRADRLRLLAEPQSIVALRDQIAANTSPMAPRWKRA